jgi:Arc/MetJ family transcription regulator
LSNSNNSIDILKYCVYNIKYGVLRSLQMRTNIELDEKLVREAMRISGITTKKALVNKALQQFIDSNDLKELLKYQGAGIWEGNLEEMRTTR